MLAWLWEDSPDAAMMMLADYIAELRYHNPHRFIDPAIRLDDVLQWLPMGLPFSLPADERERLIETARAEIPNHFSRDVNT